MLLKMQLIPDLGCYDRPVCNLQSYSYDELC